jgi:hypothetical protein
MDILNFISWIKGKRQVTAVDPAKTLLPVGLKDPRRDEEYLAGAITVQDFINQVGTGAVGPQGPIGPQGVPGPVGPAGLIWQGLWSALGIYAENDAVSFAGASYFCYNPAGIGPSALNPVTDTANWALLAAEGATGPQGPQGIQGIQGPGSPGFASTGLFSTNSPIPAILTSILIPANTFTSQSAFSVVAQFTKTTGYTGTARYYINAANTLVGATQIATSGAVATSVLYNTFTRNFHINGNALYGFSSTTSNISDVVASANVGSTTLVDWTTNQYFIVAGEVSNVSFNYTCRGVKIY